MNLLADCHTHTLASGHAYSTIDEMAQYAKETGIELIAITDHGGTMPGGAHLFYFHNLRVTPEVLYGVKILKGAEVNIVDYEGTIDMPYETLEELDLVIASFHPPCIEFGNEEQVTTCLEKVMQNPLVSIIGHPGDARYPFDAKRIAKVAKQTNTLLEVNNASLKPTSFRPGVRENVTELLKWCKTYEVPIIVNSDAHIAYDIGRLEESKQLLESVDFPEHLIMNTNIEELLNKLQAKRKK